MGCFPGPYLAKCFNRSAHQLKHNSFELFRGGTSSSTGMAAVVIATAHVPLQKKSILTSRAVFANHLPRIGVLNGNSDSTGCVRGGREDCAIILCFIYTVMVFVVAMQALSASFNALSVGNGIGPFSFFMTASHQ